MGTGGADCARMPPSLHTILGANGVIGREISRALPSDVRIRQVSRHPRAENPIDETFAADLLDREAVERAVAGSAVAYLVAGLKYDARVWAKQWPVVMRNTIDACKRHGVRLVFFDNVYAYGLVDGAMTETTPFRPISRKGEVRAAIATMLLKEMRAGEVQAMIVRSADFYGPGAAQSFPNVIVFERLRAGKKPQWIGDPDAIHTFTHTPDAGGAVAALARSTEAYGQTWHLPTSRERLTGAEFVRLACDIAGRSYNLEVAPRWLLRLMGVVVPVLRENQEMLYQLENDYVFDSSRIEAEYGLKATGYREGIERSLAS